MTTPRPRLACALCGARLAVAQARDYPVYRDGVALPVCGPCRQARLWFCQHPACRHAEVGAPQPRPAGRPVSCRPCAAHAQARPLPRQTGQRLPHRPDPPLLHALAGATLAVARGVLRRLRPAASPLPPNVSAAPLIAAARRRRHRRRAPAGPPTTPDSA